MVGQRSTRLAYTVLRGEQEHLKIKTSSKSLYRCSASDGWTKIDDADATDATGGTRAREGQKIHVRAGAVRKTLCSSSKIKKINKVIYIKNKK
jgi:hypothetical protein